MRKIINILILIGLVSLGACTDYTSGEEKARAARAKDSIVVAEKEALEAEQIRRQALEDGIMAMQDSTALLP